MTTVSGDVEITPVFEADVPPVPTPMTVSAHLYDNETEAPITNGYAYIVGVQQLTEEPYISDDYALTDANGLFTINNVPEDVFGVLIVGAPGYVNRGQLLSYEYPATDFYLIKGIQCNLNIPESASTVFIEKGSNVTLDIPYLGVRTIPLDYDLDFGTKFLPFGMTPQGTFDFEDDGRLNYNLTKNGVDVLGVDINIKVVPKDGYTFKCWMLNDEPISGQYQLKEGDKDVTVTPYFETVAPGPTPGPTPVNPSIGTKTFDNIDELLIAIVFFAAAFSVVCTLKYARRKRN